MPHIMHSLMAGIKSLIKHSIQKFLRDGEKLKGEIQNQEILTDDSAEPILRTLHVFLDFVRTVHASRFVAPVE